MKHEFKESRLSNEDRIKDIYQSIIEIESLLRIINSAINNEYEPPEDLDIKNAFDIILEQIRMLKIDTIEFINYFEESEKSSSSDNEILKA